jgi:large conductance mechanosensitive channel
MLKEFKTFIFRGNLLDLAAAVILGTAFSRVVTALVEGVLTPIIAAIGGQPNFSSLVLGLGDGEIRYGTFLDAVISFVIVAAVLFMILKAATRAQKLRASTDIPEEDAVPPSDEAVLLAEIRDLLEGGALGGRRPRS